MKNSISPILSTQSLAIGYKIKKQNTVLVSDISVTIKPRQLVGLVGANGVGKSTFLKTLTKVQCALSGSIFINGIDLNNISALELAKQLSVVPTEPLHAKNLSVYELIALGRQPYTNWIGYLTAKDNLKVSEAIQLTNIRHLKHKRCFELSDGQLQKIMIARALAQDTDLIILDEPTTHLDLYHKAYIVKLLQKLTKEIGKTILFSTHDIDLAIQLCDTILVMHNKKLIFDTPSNLISKNIFKTLFPKDLINFDNKSGTFIMS